MVLVEDLMSPLSLRLDVFGEGVDFVKDVLSFRVQISVVSGTWGRNRLQLQDLLLEELRVSAHRSGISRRIPHRADHRTRTGLVRQLEGALLVRTGHNGPQRAAEVGDSLGGRLLQPGLRELEAASLRLGGDGASLGKERKVCPSSRRGSLRLFLVCSQVAAEFLSGVWALIFCQIWNKTRSRG